AESRIPAPYMLQTIVDYGSRSGAGSKTSQQVLDAIWKNYSGQNAKRAFDGQPLHYYNNWMFPPLDARGNFVQGPAALRLVWFLDGQCGDWEQLMAYNLEAQGVLREPAFSATNFYYVSGVFARLAYNQVCD